MLARDHYEPMPRYLAFVFADRLKPLRGYLRHVTAMPANAGGIAMAREKYGHSLADVLALAEAVAQRLSSNQ
jgi:hypothetical protein